MIGIVRQITTTEYNQSNPRMPWDFLAAGLMVIGCRQLLPEAGGLSTGGLTDAGAATLWLTVINLSTWTQLRYCSITIANILQIIH